MGAIELCDSTQGNFLGVASAVEGSTPRTDFPFPLHPIQLSIIFIQIADAETLTIYHMFFLFLNKLGICVV